MNSVVKAILEGNDIQQSIAVNEKVRFDLEKALRKCDRGYELSGRLEYGLSDDELKELAKLHKENPDLREKIEDLLTDINFHRECADFAKGRYVTYLGPKDIVVKNRGALSQLTKLFNQLKSEMSKTLDFMENPYLDAAKQINGYDFDTVKKKLEAMHDDLVQWCDVMSPYSESKITEETGDASYYEVVYGYQMAIVKTDWPTTDYGAITDILIDNLEKEGVKEPYLIPATQAEEEYNPDEYVIGGNHSLALIHNGNFNIMPIPEQDAMRYKKNDHIDIYEEL